MRNKNVQELDQDYFESKILKYQEAVSTKNKYESEEIFDKIKSMYRPEQYYPLWKKQYKYLYDSDEDFEQDYMRIFIQALLKWRPKNQRTINRYGGAGTFKNYFWGSLSHHYINLVKSMEGAAKRNLTTRCPECGDWVSPISTHIIKKHSDLLFEKLQSDGIEIDAITSCPFCKNLVYKGKANLTENELIKRHILSKHLHMLFDLFYERHPMTHSGSTSTIGIDLNTSTGDENFTVYDVTPSKDSMLQKLMSMELTNLQKDIIENILSKNTINLKYSKSIYNCSVEEFNEAIEMLKENISLVSPDDMYNDDD